MLAGVLNLIQSFTQVEPSGRLRFVKRPRADALPGQLFYRILQQEWVIVTFEGMAPVSRTTEWRDVPEVEE